MKPKPPSANQKPARSTPAAPPVYRPQPIPKVLQTKRTNVSSVVRAPDVSGKTPAVQPNLREAHNKRLAEQHHERVAQQQLIRVVRPHIAAVGARSSNAAAVLLKRAPGVVQAKALATRSQTSRHGSVVQLADVADVPIIVKEGLEGGVNWYWVENLTIKVSNHSPAVEVPPHPVHSKPVNGFNQIFYGGYTIVYFHEGAAFSKSAGPWHPTTKEHTEPQFFAWLEQAIGDEPILKEAHTDVVCVIIEINQTFTPCSKGTCRKEILSWVSSKKWTEGSYCVARMSAYDLYSHQAPKVGFTSFDAKKIRQAKSVVTLSGPAAVHRIPENYNQF